MGQSTAQAWIRRWVVSTVMVVIMAAAILRAVAAMALPETTPPTLPIHPKTLSGPDKVSATLPLWVRTTDGHSYGAKRIRLGWNDQLQIVGPSGRVTHVPAAKVAKIQDGEGNDLTQVALDGHEVIGTESGTADSLKAIPISDIVAAESVRPPRRPPLSGILIQGAYLFRLGDPKESIDTGYGPREWDRLVFQAELGGMGRVGDKYGVGLSVLLAGNQELTAYGFKARVRRVLGPKTHLDIAPGYIHQVPQNGDLRESKGFVGEVSIVGSGWVGATVQFQSVELDEVNGGSKTDWWWYAGPRFMGLPGLPAAIVALMAIGISQTVE